MELKIQDEIGRLGLPITALYNKQAELVYEAHDELPCEFLSVELLEALEQHFPLQSADVEELISIFKKAWCTWANLDDENRLYDPEKFQQLVNLLREQAIEDRYLLIQEIVALLGKGVNRYGEKMRAMDELLDENLDHLLLMQGRGKPTAESLKDGRAYLSASLASYCEARGLKLDQADGKAAFERLFEIALQEEHMAIFTQI